jgi:hypothetical protein
VVLQLSKQLLLGFVVDSQAKQQQQLLLGASALFAHPCLGCHHRWQQLHLSAVLCFVQDFEHLLHCCCADQQGLVLSLHFGAWLDP